MAFGYTKMNIDDRIELFKALGFELQDSLTDSEGISEIYLKLIYSNNQSNLRKYFKCEYRVDRFHVGPKWNSCWIRDGSRYSTSKSTSFDVVFESLTPEEQDVAIFNLELLR